MKARVQKWGNSLAIRIPRGVAAELKVANRSLVELSLSEGRLIVEPLREEGPSLEELIEGITPDNCHEEVDWGAPTGREAR